MSNQVSHKFVDPAKLFKDFSVGAKKIVSHGASKMRNFSKFSVSAGLIAMSMSGGAIAHNVDVKTYEQAQYDQANNVVISEIKIDSDKYNLSEKDLEQFSSRYGAMVDKLSDDDAMSLFYKHVEDSKRIVEKVDHLGEDSFPSGYRDLFKSAVDMGLKVKTLDRAFKKEEAYHLAREFLKENVVEIQSLILKQDSVMDMGIAASSFQGGCFILSNQDSVDNKFNSGVLNFPHGLNLNVKSDREVWGAYFMEHERAHCLSVSSGFVRESVEISNKKTREYSQNLDLSEKERGTLAVASQAYSVSVKEFYADAAGFIKTVESLDLSEKEADVLLQDIINLRKAEELSGGISHANADKLELFRDMYDRGLISGKNMERMVSNVWSKGEDPYDEVMSKVAIKMMYTFKNHFSSFVGNVEAYKSESGLTADRIEKFERKVKDLSEITGANLSEYFERVETAKEVFQGEPVKESRRHQIFATELN